MILQEEEVDVVAVHRNYLCIGFGILILCVLTIFI